MGFTSSSVVKNSCVKTGDMVSMPALGRSPGEGNGNPVRYAYLGNPMNGELGGLESMGSQRVGHN